MTCTVEGCGIFEENGLDDGYGLYLSWEALRDLEASGASIANAWAGFGTDMYIREYLSELGAPWANPEAWDRVSYPFKKADRIVTPTLFLVGEKDYNVPLLATEQMYQALKVLGVPTRLVIYPGQSHGISTPSYKADRWQRYLDWYAQHLEK